MLIDINPAVFQPPRQLGPVNTSVFLQPDGAGQPGPFFPLVGEDGRVCATHASGPQDVDAVLGVADQHCFLGVALALVVIFGVHCLADEFLEKTCGQRQGTIVCRRYWR